MHMASTDGVGISSGSYLLPDNIRKSPESTLLCINWGLWVDSQGSVKI